jgi:hypothetical protein
MQYTHFIQFFLYVSSIISSVHLVVHNPFLWCVARDFRLDPDRRTSFHRSDLVCDHEFIFDREHWLQWYRIMSPAD